MNTYIMEALKNIKHSLSSDEVITAKTIDSVIGELEMMKMEIEQHITNMPKTDEHKSVLDSATCAVDNLESILELLADFSCVGFNERLELTSEIFELLDDISY